MRARRAVKSFAVCDTRAGLLVDHIGAAQRLFGFADISGEARADGGNRTEEKIMNEFIVPETGEYWLWTCDPARRNIRVLIDGVQLNAASSNLPDGKPKVEIVLELANGTVITTEPGNAPFVVRTSDGKVVHDTTGEACVLGPAARPFLPCARGLGPSRHPAGRAEVSRSRRR